MKYLFLPVDADGCPTSARPLATFTMLARAIKRYGVDARSWMAFKLSSDGRYKYLPRAEYKRLLKLTGSEDAE